ncbi:Gfo/Idh/MocA family oxidoreductase [Kiritimatiellaeota bacterium B1221]|nr:Gfo/Idh/MocA family oxidoreductase [Kiritimatiellaeota bacterium B1221]
MTKKLGVGVVGASGWMAGALTAGIEYVDGDLDKAVKHPDSVVTGLCARNQDILKERKELWGLDQADLYSDYEDMLKSPRIDAVVISVPNHLHAKFALQALEAGKHVFLEKPLATDPDESAHLLAAAAKSPCTTKVDYILVHYDEQKKLRRLIKDGAFGQVASTHFTYRHPIQIGASADQQWKLSRAISGGAIPMGICHAISLTVFQVDSDPVEVICKSAPALDRDFDYPPRQDLLITFANGVVSVVQGNIDFAEKYDARHNVCGTQGQFDYVPSNPRKSRAIWSSRSMAREYTADPDFAKDHMDSGDVWEHQCAATVNDFVQNAKQGIKDPVLGFESPLVQRTEAIIWAAEKSSASEGDRIRI